MTKNLISFWKWMNLSPYEYSVQERETKCPFDYPWFDNLVQWAKDNINRVDCSLEEIEDVLTILALDNEAENLLDFLVTDCSDEMLEKIVSVGMFHMQPHARWQVAELVYRRTPENYVNYLLKLSKDDHSYVRKRATILLSMLTNQQKKT